MTNDFVDSIRDKFSAIDGSKAMLGNTFSDFIGALLGAGVVSLFTYMTAYDGAPVNESGLTKALPFLRHFWRLL